jgi:hypothetical protein
VQNFIHPPMFQDDPIQAKLEASRTSVIIAEVVIDNRGQEQMVAKVNGLARLGELIDGLNTNAGATADELAELLVSTEKRIKDGMDMAKANVGNLVKTAENLDKFNSKFGNNPPLDDSSSGTESKS